jgi:hypothetical protein
MSDAREGKESADEASWRDAYRAGLPAGSGECPDERELAALVLGEVTGDARVRLADHVVACGRCAAAYRTLVELHEAASRAPKDEAGSSRARWSRRRLMGWAAAAAIVAGGGLLVRVFLAPTGPGGGSLPIVRGGAGAALAVEPPAGARLLEPPQRLAWTAMEPRAMYRVVVYDAESTPIWRSAPTPGRVMVLPASLRERLARGGTFYWRVRVDGESGSSSTPLHRFVVSR